MTIDAHVHIHPDPDGFGVRYDASIENLIRQLDSGEVQKAVVLPIAASTGLMKPVDNEFIAKCCGRYPDRLIGFASVHPILDRDPVQKLAEDHQRYGLRGLKLHPRHQGFAVNDPRVAPVVEKAAELGLPVAIDCMLWKPTPLRDQLPFNVDDLCKRVPEAVIIMCHAGGWRFLDALAVLKSNDNVYLDLSVTLLYYDGTPFEDQFMFVLKQAGAKRLIYGSDFPEHPIQSNYERSTNILIRHGFSPEDLALICGRNILRLIGERP